MSLDWDRHLSSDPSVALAYRQILESIASSHDEIGERPVAPFFPEVGSKYQGTVIVGQATWGWEGSHSAAELRDEAPRDAAIAAAMRVHRDVDEPMSWIESRKRNMSGAFWRVTRMVVEALEPQETVPWFARFAWTNLYPVGWQWPQPGSPDGPLRSAQDPHVAELLNATLRALDARRVVIYGGGYWWPTSEAEPFTSLREATRPLQASGVVDGMAMVVGLHPAGAQRRGTSRQDYASLIAREIGVLAA